MVNYMGKIVLIDGNSILNRAFYGIPNLTNSKGVHTNAVYGFLNILLKILDEENPEYITVAFDVKHPTFRHEMYKEYKGTRKKAPDEFIEQLPIIKDVLKSMNIKVIEQKGIEADDILGTIAKQSEKDGLDVSLVSGDRDLLQIATDKIKIRIPKTKKGGTQIEDYYTQDVIEKYQVTPLQIIDLKGLMGDASDNIPGVPGVGEKTATKIIKAFDSVENAIEHIDEVMPNKARESLREHKDMALLSKTLATIKIDCDIDFKLEDAKLEDIFNEKSVDYFRELEFKSLIAKAGNVGNNDSKIDDMIEIVDDFNKCEDIFSKLEKSLANKKCSIKFVNDKGMSIAISSDKVYFIRCEGFINFDYLAGKLEEVKALIVTDNLKEQLSYLNYSNTNSFSSKNMFDTSVAAYLLNPIIDSYNYDDIAKDYLGLLLPSKKEIIGKQKKGKVDPDMDSKLEKIACYEAYVSFMAYDKLVKELKNENMYELMNTIELPLIFVLYEMQERGIKVNKDILKEQADKLAKRIEELEILIYDIAGEEFNINSPKQLGVILFEKMKLPFAKKTKTGYSTSADILEKLRCESPIINYILEYRTISKLKSTYADGLVNYIDDDGRIRSTFNQTITATGRISSTDPNLQNIPIRIPLGRQIRKAFVPENDYVFVDADYSQIELRVLAHMADDNELIKAYHSAQDIHKITASKVFHTPLDEVTSEQRSNAKAVNFGIVYGISSFGLGQDLNITRKEADTYIKSYFKTYPKIKEFLDKLVAEAKEHGYVTTLYNRKRPVPEILSSNFMQRSFGERIAMNSPIQGTAADIIKIAMIRVNDRLKSEGLKSRLLLQIHDELLVETHKSEIDIVKNILNEEMHNAASLKVPLEIDVNQGESWYESK